jgi:4a-hydroxytetrahydrobiopterin dehydratase
VATLSDDEVTEELRRLRGWGREGDAIAKEFELRSFNEAIAFVNCVAHQAEAANHHPDIDIRYRKVRTTLSTHSEGGITAKDMDLAAQIEECVPAT